MRSSLEDRHPAVSFAYFCVILGFTMVLVHPLCRLFSLLGALLWLLQCRGAAALGRLLRLLVPLMLLAALINPAFSHGGVTILAYLPTGNPLTLEAILYGLSMAVLLAAVVAWCFAFQPVLTGEKLAALFGRRLPALTMLLTMALGFLPRLTARFRAVNRAQEGIGHGTRLGTMPQRLKNAGRILAILLTWSLEDAIETADSMKSRGYGEGRRTAFSPYRFSRRDGFLLAIVLALGMLVLLLALLGGLSFRYYPYLRGGAEPGNVIALLAYLALSLTPWIIEHWEARAWRFTNLKT